MAADRGANRHLAPDDLPIGLRAAALLVSGFVLLHEDTRPTGVAALAMLEAEWRAVTAGSADLVQQVGDLPGDANALFANADEAMALTGQAPEPALEQLGDRYRLVCITLGAEGALAVLDGVQERRRVAPATGRTRGAGDAFAAGVLLALARGAELGAALERGCELGARAATGRDYGRRRSPGRS